MIQSRTPPVVDETYYPASDGQPVGETPPHVKNLFYLYDSLGGVSVAEGASGGKRRTGRRL